MAFVLRFLAKKKSFNSLYAFLRINKENFKQSDKAKNLTEMWRRKNPAYGRQSISWPMRIVVPIPQYGGPRIADNPNFLKNGKNHPKHKNSKKSRDMPILAIYPSTRGL